MGSLLANLNLVHEDIILGMGIRFWFKLMEDQKICDIGHCQYVINHLQGVIDDVNNDVAGCRRIRPKLVPDSNYNNVQDSREVQDHDEEIVIVLVLGIKFWQNTVAKQKINELNHCKVIINYLQGFLNDIIKNSGEILGEDNLKKDDTFHFDVKCEENIGEVDEEYGFNDIDGDFNGDNTEDEEYKPGMDMEKSVKPKILDIKFSDNDFIPKKEEEDLSHKKDKILQRIERAKSKRANSKVKLIKYKKMGGKVYTQEWNPDFSVISCDYCNETFPTVYITGQHVDIAHQEKKKEFDRKYKTFKCSKPECGKLCYTVKSLHRHYRDYHKENIKDVSIYAQKLKECEICKKSFKIQSSYEDHMEEHKVGLGTKLIQCKICKMKFHYRSHLRKHLSSKGDSESTLCSQCGESFDNRCELKVHKKVHCKDYKKFAKKTPKKLSGPQKCTLCDLIFESFNKKHLHMFHVHDQGAAFCDICGHKCWGNSHLRKHVEVHNESLSFECQHCGKGFKSKRNLERHIQVVHTSDSNKKFQCTQCGKGFTTTQNLQNHMNIHLGLKPFKCEFCGSSYQNQSNLSAHKKKSCKVNLNVM